MFCIFNGHLNRLFVWGEMIQNMIKMATKNKITSVIQISFFLLFVFQCFKAQAQTTFKMPISPYGAVIVDYDLDGDNDVVVGCSGISSSDVDSIVIMFNDGWGNFELEGFEANSGIFIYCEDLTNDGYPDIISRDDSIFFHENNQNGGLGTLHNICHTIGNRRIGGIADMDANGFLDIIYYGIHVIRGWGIAYNIDGYTFNDEYLYYSDENEYLSVGYLNNDSLADVLVTARSIPEGAYIMYNNLNTFQKEMISTRHWAYSHIFDIDNDTENEACLEWYSAHHTVLGKLSFFKKVGNNEFDLVDSSIIKGAGSISCIDDFDLDGYQDIAVTVVSGEVDPSEDSVYIYRNNHHLGFELHDFHYIGEPGYFQSVISGDLNMDGFSDLVTVNYHSMPEQIQILWNDGTGHFIDTNSVYVFQNEHYLIHHVNIYPNPSLGSISIHSGFEKIKALKIVDFKGTTLLRREFSTAQNKIELDLGKPNLQTGIYICVVELENGRMVFEKVVLNCWD